MTGVVRIEGAELERTFTITGRDLENLLSWQPRAGEAVTVIDGKGRGFRARRRKLQEGRAELSVFEAISWPVIPGFKITLLQALPDKERMELIIEKATELGVSTIIPFKSKRSISLEERERRQRKAHRWPYIALKAAKQSRRATIPVVEPFCTFEEALRRARAPLRIMVWEGEGEQHLKDYLKDRPAQDIDVMVGPEGGFDEAEVEEARTMGFATVSLGGRVLRTETAAIAIVGIIQYEFGM